MVSQCRLSPVGDEFTYDCVRALLVENGYKPDGPSHERRARAIATAER